MRCAAAAGALAPDAARIAINGTHEHEFMNPSGIRFRVGCFATAPGCMPEGERSTVWTWFPGHAWQIELCRACGGAPRVVVPRRARRSAFYGLVRDRSCDATNAEAGEPPSAGSPALERAVASAQNWCASVESSSARVDDLPPEMTSATWSK